MKAIDIEKRGKMRVKLKFDGIDRELIDLEHFENCEICLAELQICLERYPGREPWFLFDEEENPYIWFGEMEISLNDGGIPRIGDYKIGCYGNPQEDTKRFIMDRIRWAKKYMRKSQRFKGLEKMRIIQ